MSKKESFIDIAKSQVGYTENPKGSNNTKYAKYFDTDAWQFFNTKKNPCDWCAIFVHWCACQVVSPKEVRKLFGEPDPKDNCGAGVKYFWRYLEAKGYTFKPGKKEPEDGDIIFFNNLGHVGIVEHVDSKVHTIEGNKSNTVKRCTYTKTSTKIYGYARVKWQLDEYVPAYKNEPAREFDKKYAKEYEVTCNCQLLTAVRKNPKVITLIKKGTIVKCYGYYTGNFLYIKAGNFEGYLCKNHLK